ncbi:MAG TPA: NUDIX domain-containing protein [Solirubrobacteraceae bacterium]|nr:NUDIX domain-containing protein [Solirubrobacteraceae bacterium]
MAASAATVVLLRDDRVLLVAHDARWGLPGGKLRRGESPPRAAARELAEETGVRADPRALVALGEPFAGEGGRTLHPFALPRPPARVVGGELRARWTALGRLPALALLPGVGRSVHAALRILGAAEDAQGQAARALLSWWERERRALPWRETRDPYAILVCEVMSQQTQIERVAVRWQEWLARWPTPAALARAPLAEVLRAWQGLGYPRRARDLHAACASVAAEGWPAPERLTDLPGVGAYTAAAIRCFAHEAPVLPPDANTARVLARRFPAGLRSDGAAWALGGAVMELGQRACRPRPRCDGCPLARGCLVALQPGTFDPAPRARRQAPYAGSLRERRGRLLRAVLAGEAVALASDPEAAASLIKDGLAGVEGTRLTGPSA